MQRSIATRTGDDGTTSLLYGRRIAKDHPRIETVGALDELNVALGAAKAMAAPGPSRAFAAAVQGCLIALMGELSCAGADAARYARSQFARVAPADLQRLDAAVAALEHRGLRLDGWAAPGANRRAAAWDQARVTARRAERRLVGLSRRGRPVRPLLLRYLNRLSDVLWLLAREAESSPGRRRRGANPKLKPPRGGVR